MRVMEPWDSIIDYESKNDLMMVDQAGQKIHAPVTLNPSPFCKTLHEEAVAIQPLFNDLLYSMVQERSFIEEVSEK